jgi:glycosyltransferase involved in cell wall biosynthesis
MKVMLIIPAYNESENLEKLITQIVKQYPQYDYIIVNDGSTDDTEGLCRREDYNFITLPVNLGIGGAVQTGYRYALEKGADIAVQIDGDGQHDIGYVDNVIAPIINGKADIVIGSRFVKGDRNSGEFRSTGMRRAGIKWLSGVIRFLTGKRVYDVTSGFRAADKKYISYFAYEYSADYPEPEAIVSTSEMGARIAEVPVIMHERVNGKSSIGFWNSGYYMIKVTLSLFISRLSFGFRR